jgi:hypothetical protein
MISTSIIADQRFRGLAFGPARAIRALRKPTLIIWTSFPPRENRLDLVHDLVHVRDQRSIRRMRSASVSAPAAMWLRLLGQ